VSCDTRVSYPRVLIFAYGAVTLYGRPFDAVLLMSTFVTRRRRCCSSHKIPRPPISNASTLALIGCLARSFGSRLAPANRQADARPVASTDPHGQATRLRGEADVNGAAPVVESSLRRSPFRPGPSASQCSVQPVLGG
jgi:hypothetical protein